MEVCGRYHHWMPILVQVAHKDIFVSWCLAFIKALEAQSSSGVVTPHLSGGVQGHAMLSGASLSSTLARLSSLS